MPALSWFSLNRTFDQFVISHHQLLEVCKN